MVEKAYLKIVYPTPNDHSMDDVMQVRFGLPTVYLIDRDGRELYEVDGIQSASIFAHHDSFLSVDLSVIGKVEFPDSK